MAVSLFVAALRPWPRPVWNVRAEQAPEAQSRNDYVAESCCFIAMSCVAVVEVGVCDAPSVSC